MSNEIIEVQISSRKQCFAEFYYGFIGCDLLTGEEKIVLISLMSFLDIQSDDSNIPPTIKRIQKITSWSKQEIINQIKNLEKKGVIKRVEQGPDKPTLYILSDEPIVGTRNIIEEVIAKEHIAELERMGYEVKLEKRENDTIES